MRAIVEEAGRLRLAELPDPEPGPGEVRVAVAATAVNRADLVQRAGHYDPPPGESPILGLECAGVVESVGPGCGRFRVGDRVAALLAGGGYATRVVVPEGQLLPAGDLPFPVVAALPEAVCTVHDALFVQAGLRPGERVLVHAGASGIGTTAIRMARLRGSPCFATVGSAEKVAACLALGAEGAWDRRAAPWTEAPWLSDGVDVILDPVGATTLEGDVAALRTQGRLVVLGLLGGRRATLDLGRLLTKRLRILGTVLRNRPRAEKAEVVRQVAEDPWVDVLKGRLEPSLHAILPLDRAEDAHALVASDRTVGKVVLTIAA